MYGSKFFLYYLLQVFIKHDCIGYQVIKPASVV